MKYIAILSLILLVGCDFNVNLNVTIHKDTTMTEETKKETLSDAVNSATTGTSKPKSDRISDLSAFRIIMEEIYFKLAAEGFNKEYLSADELQSIIKENYQSIKDSYTDEDGKIESGYKEIFDHLDSKYKNHIFPINLIGTSAKSLGYDFDRYVKDGLSMKSDDHWKNVNLAYFATQKGAKDLFNDVLDENSIFNQWPKAKPMSKYELFISDGLTRGRESFGNKLNELENKNTQALSDAVNSSITGNAVTSKEQAEDAAYADMNDDSVVVTDTNNTTNQLPEASTGFSYGPAILPQGYGVPLDKQALIQKGLEGEIIKYLQQRAKSQAEDESDPLKGQRDNMSYSNAINKASEAYIQRYR